VSENVVSLDPSVDGRIPYYHKDTPSSTDSHVVDDRTLVGDKKGYDDKSTHGRNPNRIRPPSIRNVELISAALDLLSSDLLSESIIPVSLKTMKIPKSQS